MASVMWLWLVLRWSCFTIALGMLVAITIWYAQGGRLYQVPTSSMQPTFSAGDAVATERVSVRDLTVGDVIAYRDSEQSSLVISHRIIARNKAAHTLSTQGDSSKTPDMGISDGQVVGRVTVVAPNFGHVMQWLQTPVGIFLAVYMPVAGIMLYELRRWYKNTRTKTYLFNKV